MLIDNDMHDNEDMMMILMILLTIMIMKSNCDRCLLARTDQQRGPSFDPTLPSLFKGRQSLPELNALGWPTCSSLCLFSLGEAPC